MIRKLALFCLLGLATITIVGGAAWPGSPTARQETQRVHVVVTLEGPPLAGDSDPASRNRIDGQQARFETALHSEIPTASVHWRYRLVANGMSVMLPAADLPRLARIPGVAKVFTPVTYRTLVGPAGGTIGARTLPGLALADAGAGMKIGIIDDGVDQSHPFFNPAGYVMPAGFPKGQTAYTTAKVIVARAFPPPGTTYPRARLPFDNVESGHATHVAGIAAGNQDTNAAGATISGVAPHAYIGNYKALTVPTDADVGLDGNAPELVAAIESAVADGMDVINLSLGEPEIEPSNDIVALALDAAADAGVVPVVAAGNDFDEFGFGSVSSPGSSAKAITVAASTDSSAPDIASFSSAGPTPISLRLKPDVTAPGVAILSSVPDGWTALSGTSMASPHVAGAAALLLQRHPDWTPELVKAALMSTARPALEDGELALPVRAGAGFIDVAAADTPLLLPRPASLSFGLLPDGAASTTNVELLDAGAGAGDWTVTVDSQSPAAKAAIDVPAVVAVPGSLPVSVAVDPTATDADLTGAIVLTRGADVRRIPYWGHLATASLAGASRTVLTTPGEFSGNTRGRPTLVTRYRYPELPEGGPVRSRLAGPEQVFRIKLTHRVANFGVVIVKRGRGVEVEPRVVKAGDENRLTGYAALPLNLNPYVIDFGQSTLSAGADAPLRGAYDIVFDSATVSGAGAFRFRLWVNDVTPPSATLLTPTVKQGQALGIRLADKGSGIDPSSIRATLGGKEVAVAIVGAVARLDTSKLKAGRFLLRFQISDNQESRNMENVGPILPNTRVISTRVTITR
jgi:subtilisin family serine protease